MEEILKPKPWDSKNLERNLAALAKLNDKNHLRVLKAASKSSQKKLPLSEVKIVRPSSKFRREKLRVLRHDFKIVAKGKEKTGESVLNDNLYATPIKRIFQAALKNKFAHKKIEHAFDGLIRWQGSFKNVDELNKAKEILQNISDLLPPEFMYKVMSVLGEYRWQTKTWNHHIIKMISQPRNRYLCEEYQNDKLCPKKMIKAIFGAKPSNQVTDSPVTSTKYSRKGIGVCTQFGADCIQRSGALLNGNPIQVKKEPNSLQQLFDLTDRDEGLMWVVSQIVNQASLGAVPFFLINGAAQNDNPFLILPNSKRLRVLATKRGFRIDIRSKKKGVLNLTCEHIFDKTTLVVPNERGDPRPLSDFRINSVKVIVGVEVIRIDNSFKIGVSELKFIVKKQ